MQPNAMFGHVDGVYTHPKYSAAVTENAEVAGVLQFLMADAQQTALQINLATHAAVSALKELSATLKVADISPDLAPEVSLTEKI